VLRWQVIVEQDQVDETVPFGQIPDEMLQSIFRAIDDAKTWF
jgi:hypothetical protein